MTMQVTFAEGVGAFLRRVWRSARSRRTLLPMRSTGLWMIVGLLFSLASSPAAAQTTPACPENPPSALAEPEPCQRVIIEACIRGGEAYSLPIGDGLVFQLQPEPKNRGWKIVVSPEKSRDDWAYPVNPPLHSANAQVMMTGWGESARSRLRYPHSVYFPLKRGDYLRMAHMAANTLWPNPQKVVDINTEYYFTALAWIRKGMVEVTALDYDRDGPPESVQWMRFRAVVTVPSDFAADPRLDWTGSACAPPWRR